MSNLRQFGLGIIQHSSDHEEKIMAMVEQWGIRPNFMRFTNQAEVTEWSIDQIQPYVQTFSMANQNIYGVAMCPEVNAQLMNRWIREVNFVNFNFIEFQYSYFGRVERVEESQLRGNAREELTSQQFEANRLLMSDIIFTQEGGQWRYNHGPRGWAYNEVDYMPQDDGPEPNLSGINHLFGDGHVDWKKRSEFPHLDKMRFPTRYPGSALALPGRDAYYW